MRKTAFVMGVLAAGCVVLMAGAGREQPAGEPGPRIEAPKITVSATAEVQRKPELAIVRIGAEFREATASAASEKAGAAMEQVARAIEGLKLAGVQLQTSGVSLSPAYDYRQDELRRLLGYDAVSVLRVRVEDPKSVGRIIDAAITAGANRVEGISFELKEAVEPRREAIRLAGQAAREKAETLASALGLKIKSVVTATASNDSPGPWETGTNRRQMMAAEGIGGSIEPGLITFSAEATVTFAAE